VLLFTENYLTERMVYRMFFLGRNFESALICTLKSKKHKKLFLKNLRFFQLCVKQPWVKDFKIVSAIFPAEKSAENFLSQKSAGKIFG